MKKIIFLLVLCISFIANAQTLEHKIPRNTEAVISVNGNRLLELISITDFNESEIAKELFKELNRKRESSDYIKSIESLGFDISSKTYYFYQSTDSIGYHNFIIKLNDRKVFEKLISNSDDEKIEHKGNISILSGSYNNISIWNDNMLLFTGSDPSYSYFEKNRERLSMIEENKERSAATVEAVESGKESERKESVYSIKSRISKIWLKNYALQILNNNPSQSILKNTSYVKRMDTKAASSFWINNYSELINKTMRSSLGYLFMYPNDKPGISNYGIDGVWGNFYLENDATRFTANMEINKDWLPIYKKMYKSKLNSAFFNHFDQDNVLAYASMSFNMQNTLEAYPKIVSNMYGGMMPKYKEEIELATEVTSILLDEEAIAKVITGNMLFVLNSISEKEVSYTSYEYDDDYKRTEVTKTKKESLPDFTIMMGTKNKKLVQKLMLLGAKHELVNAKSNYYKIKKVSDMPFDLFFVVKDDIAFLTTSESKITDIVNGRSKKNYGAHKKLIRKNSTVFYVNGKKILHNIPDYSLSGDELKLYNFAKDNLTEAYFTSSKIKGNQVKLELKMDTPAKYGNSLKFFLTFFEMIIK